jgi:hypothetical protein
MAEKGEARRTQSHAASFHAERRPTRRLIIELIAYGAPAGLVATALGALMSSAVAGSARIVLWITVTGVLALGAIRLADPILAIFFRHR